MVGIRAAPSDGLAFKKLNVFKDLAGAADGRLLLGACSFSSDSTVAPLILSSYLDARRYSEHP